MGTVFAATHKNNGSRAAIKVLHPEYARDADTKGRFLQEGYAANQVGHSGVVRILDDDTTEDGLPFIVMELLEGELLEQRRIGAGGKLPYEDVQEIGDQLLEVMVAAHAKGIVHRDIKPDNIFVTNEGYLKVLDFGFARMRDSARKEHTATGFLLGTPGFMSPEQASGTQAKIDARTDIWAVGATLFVLLTGQPVHEGETAAEMLVQAANFAVRPIGELEPNLPLKFRAIVDKALAFDRNDRFTDAKSMLNAIRALPNMRMAPPSDEDGRTLMRRSPVEADHEDRTVMGRSQEDPTMMGHVEELEPEAIESIYTPTSNLRGGGGLGHPADTEQSTLAIDPHAPTMALAHLSREQLQEPQPHQPAALSKPPMSRPAGTAKVQKYVPQDDVEEEQHDHTVMMVSRPQLQPRPQTQAMQRPMMPSPLGSSPSIAPTPRPSSPVLDQRVGSAPSYPDLSRAPQHPSPSQPQMAPFVAHSQVPASRQSQPMVRPPQPQAGASAAPVAKGGAFGSILVFIAVAGITMVVVILTGLVVIVGTE